MSRDLATKQAAFAQFSRVLRPGGRLSIFEPINSFTVAEADRIGQDPSAATGPAPNVAALSDPLVLSGYGWSDC